MPAGHRDDLEASTWVRSASTTAGTVTSVSAPTTSSAGTWSRSLPGGRWESSPSAATTAAWE